MNDETNIRHIKNQARRIKKELGIAQHAALERAAQTAGYNNWSHFVNQTKCNKSSIRRVDSRRNRSAAPIPVGTLVRLKPRGSVGMVFKSDGSTIEYYDQWGPILAVHEEVAIIRDQSAAADFRPMRLVLPYGKWKCGDGSEVLFNRDYCPLWKKSAVGLVSSISPNAWIEHDDDEEEWFYTDAARPVDNRRTYLKCVAVLKTWGVADRRSELEELLPPAIRSGKMNLLKGYNYNRDTAA